MRVSSGGLDLCTRSNESSDSGYTTNNPRFSNVVVNSTTMTMIAGGDYSVFLSANSGRTGSYSMTSQQESYRSINTSLQSRLKTR